MWIYIIEIQNDITSSSPYALLAHLAFIVFSTLLEAKDPPIKINKIMKDILPDECQEILNKLFSEVDVKGKKIMEALCLR